MAHMLGRQRESTPGFIKDFFITSVAQWHEDIHIGGSKRNRTSGTKPLSQYHHEHFFEDVCPPIFAECIKSHANTLDWINFSIAMLAGEFQSVSCLPSYKHDHCKCLTVLPKKICFIFSTSSSQKPQNSTVVKAQFFLKKTFPTSQSSLTRSFLGRNSPFVFLLLQYSWKNMSQVTILLHVEIFLYSMNNFSKKPLHFTCQKLFPTPFFFFHCGAPPSSRPWQFRVTESSMVPQTEKPRPNSLASQVCPGKHFEALSLTKD